MNPARITDGFFATVILTCLAAATLSWMGPALDASDAVTYHPSSLELTLAADRAADLEACQRSNGPRSTPAYLPDGQHRCSVHDGLHQVSTASDEAQP